MVRYQIEVCDFPCLILGQVSEQLSVVHYEKVFGELFSVFNSLATHIARPF